MKVILTGGGTGGSVTPLIAIKEKLEQVEDCQFIFIGSKNGPEEAFADEGNIPFTTIRSGKVRRYLAWQNLTDPIWIIAGFFQSYFILRKFKPEVVLTAGSFVAVPVVWAAWTLRIPCLVHQQDLKKGLANTLMAHFAKKITVTFPSSLHQFSRKKTVLTGNPVRPAILKGSKEKAIEMFNLEKGIPTLLILGGGTGALEINKIVSRSLQILEFCQVIHVAGKGKNIFQDKQLRDLHRPDSISDVISSSSNEKGSSLLSRYHVHEFLSEELSHALAVADLIATRAGISTLTELSQLGKPFIIIPLPGSHQEENAAYFEKEGAAYLISQKTLTPEIFISTIRELISNKTKLQEMIQKAQRLLKKDALENIAKQILSIRKQ